MSLLQGAQDKRAIKNASWALANLAKSNSDNKAAIREAKGIQVCWLVGLACVKPNHVLINKAFTSVRIYDGPASMSNEQQHVQRIFQQLRQRQTPDCSHDTLATF